MDGNQPNGLAEFSLRAMVSGVIIGIIFGAANAYLGLKVGLTVSASIPAAVMGITVFQALSRLGAPRATILETNMVQTVGSAGESLAAGVIFTVPALILLGFSPGALKVFALGSLGGVLGIMMMVPLRAYLIEREHGKLIYPEGTACASVLMAGQDGGSRGGLVFAGLGLGALYEFFMNGFGLWKDRASWQPWSGLQVSADSSPALLGVGYVIGPRIAAIMFGGGALAWLAFIPAIKLIFGSNQLTIYPAPAPVSELDPSQIWNYYLRYIGAGAVVFGGVMTLVKSMPLIVSSFKAAFAGMKKRSRLRPAAGRDLPGPVLLVSVAVIAVLMAALPASMAPGDLPSALLALVFSFFFVAVSSRIVGLIGSSSNPISGMTIAALLATTLIFKLLGLADESHQASALAVGAIVCIAAAIAGDTSQDLKTGYLVGATPWKQQSAEIVGVLTSAAVIGLVVLRLHDAYGIGSETLPAPQATLMSLVVKGVMTGDLPWTLVFIGALTAAVVEAFGIPSLPFAVGLYLPIAMSAPIFAGGLIRATISGFGEGKAKNGGKDEKQIKTPPIDHDQESLATKAPANADLVHDRGVLFASGLIAGAAFLGMALGLIKSLGESAARVLDVLKFAEGWAGRAGDLVSAMALFSLTVLLWAIARNKEEGEK